MKARKRQYRLSCTTRKRSNGESSRGYEEDVQGLGRRCMVAECVYVLIARAEFQLKKGCCNANQSSSFRGKQKRSNG